MGVFIALGLHVCVCVCVCGSVGVCVSVIERVDGNISAPPGYERILCVSTPVQSKYLELI